MDIRKVCEDDAMLIGNIYNYYIEHTATTFDTHRVTEYETKRQIGELLGAGFPYYVAVIDGKVVGYCHVHKWNERSAYCTTLGSTIYLDKEHTGKGIGTLLYRQLLPAINRRKYHVLLAGICIPNECSVHLHEQFGFKQSSHLKEVGWKLNQWRDVGHWQLIVDRVKVLILCTGNSCRSQMAHGFLQSFDPSLCVCSAGTKASGQLNTKAVAVMKEAGVDISHHTSDAVDSYLADAWDYVITVCGGANESCPAFTGEVKHRVHIGFDDPSDAVGTPEFIQQAFVRVRDEIKSAFHDFYTTHLKNE